MGLLILERKEWAAKYEQIKTEAESAEIVYKRDQSAHSSALAEARKREDSLKKALEIEKECIANVSLWFGFSINWSKFLLTDLILSVGIFLIIIG